MKENEFQNFLINKRYTEKSVISRMAKAQKAERILGKSYDEIVIDDDKMFSALNELQKHEDTKHNQMQNTLRSYYEFVNHKVFPKKNDYALYYK